jgi:heptose-I-phosphate ethanolaminephosphotransferase
MNPENKILNSVFALLVVFFISTLVFSGFNNTLSHVPAYSPDIKPIKLGEISLLNRQHDVNISAQFKLPETKNKTNTVFPHYENLFQTADVNFGIRLEFGYGENSTLGWAIIIGDKTGQFIGFDLGDFPLTGTWHDLKIKIKPNVLEVKVNGEVVNSTEVTMPIYLVDNLLVGQGFSKERIFQGEIKSFTIINESNFSSAIAKYQLNFIAALMIILLWFSFTHSAANQNKWLRIEASDIPTTKFITYVCIYIGFFIYFKSSYFSLSNSAPLHDVVQFILLIWISSFIWHYLNNLILRKIYLCIIGIINYICFFLLIAGSIFLDKANVTVSGAYNDELGALYQTSIMEGIEFFYVYFKDIEKITILCLAAIPTIVFWFAIRSEVLIAKSKINRSIAFVILIMVYLSHPQSETISNSLAKGYKSYSANVREFTQLVSKRQTSSSIDARVKYKGNTFVIVIGESSNRHHYSSYGYFRETTPFLNQQLPKENWLFFDRAYSSHVHTTPSLMHALTSANQYNGQDYYKANSLIEVFNAAGFDTYWIDEQARALGDNPVNVIASASKYFKVVPPNNGELLNEYKKILNGLDTQKNNLIILHLIGSHFDYKRRVPKNYSVKFDTSAEELGDDAKDEDFVKNILGPYDNTIHYTDNILDKLNKSAKRASVAPDIFVYFSDHGEDVFGRKFHNAAEFTYPMARVPLILSFSDKWIKQNSSKADLLKRRVNNVFTLDMIYNTFVGLADIQDYKYNSEYDIGSLNYKIDLGNAITMKTGEELDKNLYSESPAFRISDDPKIIAQENIRFLNDEYGPKVLANHNDTKSRVFDLQSSGFVGLEFNIAMPLMLIGHYPEQVYSTSVDSFLSWAPVQSSQRLWFDVKTIKGHDISESLYSFNALDNKFHLKKKSIIESWDDGIQSFSENGWHTSYYLLPINWPECKNFTEKLTDCGKALASKIKELKVSSISFHANYYGFIKNYVEKNLPQTTQYNIFGLSEDINIFNPALKNLAKHSAIFNDDRIHTILLENLQTF